MITFTQNAVPGSAGRIYLGATALAVTVSSSDNTGVTHWKYELVDAPTDSALVPGVLADGVSPSASFTPDAVGGYRLKLTVTVGPTTTVFYNNFYVPTPVKGWILPSFTSTDADNVGTDGKGRGWARELNGVLKDVDSFIGTAALDLLHVPTNIMWLPTLGDPTIGIPATASSGGNTLHVLGQNAAQYGGTVEIKAGTGATANGSIKLQGDATTIFTTGGAQIAYFNSNGLNLAANNVFFYENGLPPLIRQQPRTTDASCAMFIIRSQAPWGSATGINRTPGTLLFDVPPAVNGGAEGNMAMFVANTQVVMLSKNSIGFLGSLPQLSQWITGTKGGAEEAHTTAAALETFGLATDYTVASERTAVVLSDADGISFTSNQTKGRNVLSGRWPAGDFIAHLKVVFFQSEIGLNTEGTTEYCIRISRKAGSWVIGTGVKTGTFLWTVGASDPVVFADGGPNLVLQYTGNACTSTTVRWRIDAFIEPLPLPYSSDPIV